MIWKQYTYICTSNQRRTHAHECKPTRAHTHTHAYTRKHKKAAHAQTDSEHANLRNDGRKPQQADDLPRLVAHRRIDLPNKRRNDINAERAAHSASAQSLQQRRHTRCGRCGAQSACTPDDAHPSKFQPYTLNRVP